jgi:hypothetical protein
MTPFSKYAGLHGIGKRTVSMEVVFIPEPEPWRNGVLAQPDVPLDTREPALWRTLPARAPLIITRESIECRAWMSWQQCRRRFRRRRPTLTMEFLTPGLTDRPLGELNAGQD